MVGVLEGVERKVVLVVAIVEDCEEKLKKSIEE